MEMEMNRLYSVREMAKILHIGVDTLYKMIKNGRFPASRLHERGELRVCGWQAKEWLDKQCQYIGKEA